MNGPEKLDNLLTRTRRLTGRVFSQTTTDTAIRADELGRYLKKCIAYEKTKARKHSPFYDSNRHMALLQIFTELVMLKTKKPAG